MNIPEELVQLLQKARRVVVLTGAGISAESGIPTFRQAQTGLWAQYDPEELATRAAFRRNPRLVWRWYAWRRQLVQQAAPNPGHLALVEWERRTPAFTLITQNVDGLHQRAGSQNVIELHGNLLRVKCFDHDHAAPTWEEEEIPPRCGQCGSYLRPDVVWFGENLPAVALHTAVTTARGADIFLSIGTSSLVQPAASLPLEAKSRRIPIVEINPQATPLTSAFDFVLAGPAGEVLPSLLKRCFGS
ncbi:MAG TPA: NAD-dependent deacylase [Chloroflexota bacterium]|nr:NAD-dependent deacylase [Chloroflexota bacterium]